MKLEPMLDKRATVNTVKHFFLDNDCWPRIKRLSGCRFWSAIETKENETPRQQRYLDFCLAYETVKKATEHCSPSSKRIINAKYLPDKKDTKPDWQIMQDLNCEKTKFRELDVEARWEFADWLESTAFELGSTALIPDLHQYQREA